jgi:hypothetical protein
VTIAPSVRTFQTIHFGERANRNTGTRLRRR